MSHTMDNRQAKGTAIYARKLIENMLDDDRFEFTLVHYERTDDPLYKRVREIVIPEIPRLPFGTRFIRTMIFFWKYRKEDFDIMHWFQPRLYPFFWLAPARHIVVTAHAAGDITAPGQFPPSRHIYNLIMMYCGRWIDAVIGDSGFARTEIIDEYGFPPEKVHAIFHGGGEDFTHLEKSASQRLIGEKYGIKSPFILNVSRLEPHKNVDGLIRAYDSLRRKTSVILPLVIVAARRFGAEHTLALAQTSPYAGDIVFVDFVEQEHLNALYSAADLFVFPSLNEAFGLPVVEAFASGVPVITSNVTGLPEVAGDAGIVVNPRDIDALADAMHSVLTDTALRERLIQKGLARARKFTWETAAQKTLMLYRSLSGNSI